MNEENEELEAISKEQAKTLYNDLRGRVDTAVSTLNGAIDSNTEQILNKTVVPDLKWENGQINSSGQDAAGNSNRRTVGYTKLVSGAKATVEKNQNVSLTIYLYEYNANKTLLRYNSGSLLTTSDDCVYFRISTYSGSVPQGQQEQYVDVTIKTSKSIKQLSDDIETETERINDLEYDCYENQDIIYTGSKPLTAGSGMGASSVVCVADIAQNTNYILKLQYTSGAVTSNVTIYELDSNNQGTNVASLANNAEVELISTTNVKGFSVYIAGNKVATDGTLTITVTIPNTNKESFEYKINSLADGSVTSALLLHATEMKLANNNTKYVYKNIYTIYDFEVGDIYTISVDECNGATTTEPINIYVANGNDNYRRIKGNLSCSIVVTADDVENGDAIKFTLYPASGTIMTESYAVFSNVRIYKNNRQYNIGNVMTNYRNDNKILKSNTMDCVAHRGRWGAGIGAMCLGSAVVAARKYGYSTVENDVAKTSDGKMVMFHDNTLAVIGDSSHSIGDYTLSQLKEMDFGTPWGFPGEKILTFEEWILLCKKVGVNCYIDFKVTGDNFTDEMAAEMVMIVKKYGMQNHVSYLANHNKILQYHTNARLVFLSIPNTTTISQYSSLLGTNELVFNPDIHNITAELVKLAYDNGFGCECWYSCNGENKSDIFDLVEDAVDCGVQAVSLDLYTVDDVFNEKYGLT